MSEQQETLDIKNLILKIDPERDFSKVGGLKKIKEILEEEIKFLKVFTSKGLKFPFNGKLLFTGPPGTGKTLCAEAMAAELGWSLYELNSALLMSKYLGATAKNLQMVYDFLEEEGKKALNEGKGIIFLVDELDFIAKSRMSEDTGEVKRIVTTFLNKLELSRFSETGIVTIAATNHKQLLDNAAWSRFDLTLTFELPDEESRFEILEILLNEYDELALSYNPNKKDFISTITKITENFAGRDLRSLVQYLVKRAVIDQKSELNLEEAREVIEEKTIVSSSLREQDSSNIFDKETMTTIFHGELNLYQYEELLIQELKRDKKYEEFKKLALEFSKFPKQIKDSLVSLDFYFLHFKDPISYLEHLKNKSEVV